MYPPDDVFQKINNLGAKRIPFLFLVDYEMKQPWVMPLSEISPENVLFQIGNHTNSITEKRGKTTELKLTKTPLSFGEYKKKFHHVHKHFILGNTFLTNLTCPTPIAMNISLKEAFYRSAAPYKILFFDKFLSFSPETFVRIKNNIISSNPMKGTIDASLPHAEETILLDEKETAEHVTIVDLIRNDLGMVADHVSIEKYRYVDTIITNEKKLLQVSSQIRGKVSPKYRETLGTLLKKLLPAGSITGAPKKKTMEIIQEAENYTRGFYTGVAGLFDGENLESFVLIRFIESQSGGLVYKSGGGITLYSDPQKEYQEMIDKIYVPIA